MIRDIHRAYLEAGADIIETNTFGGARIVLADNKLEDRCYELNFAAGAHGAPGRRRIFDAGKAALRGRLDGPHHQGHQRHRLASRSPRSAQGYYEQAKGLVEGGADILLVETCFDTRNIKAGLLAVERLRARTGRRDSGDGFGHHRAHRAPCWPGRPPTRFYASVAHADLLSIGLNCATGPELMTDHIRTLHEMASTRISCYPNAGLPNEEGKYLETPESLAAQLERFVEHGWLNIVGGCCGTTPAHIRAIAQMAEGKQPRAVPARRRIAPIIRASNWWRRKRATGR